MEIQIINCLSTPSKLQCDDNNFNVFNGSTNAKVVSQHNVSHIEKIESYIKEKFDEVATNHLKQKILADLKEQYQPSTTDHLDCSVINSLKDHRKSLESEIQFLRKEIKEKNTLISSLIPSKILESKYCEANNLQISNSQDQLSKGTRNRIRECIRKKRQGSIRGKNENHQQCRNCKPQSQYKTR